MNKRDYNQKLIWQGDLHDDCTAKWAGLILRAEWMNETIWWWAVFDHLDNDRQIDTSNNYDEEVIEGEIARNKAEEAAIDFLKKEIIYNQKKFSYRQDINTLISDLKAIGVSPVQSILTLVAEFDFDYSSAKETIFNAPVWKGLREQSEALTQMFLDASEDNADEVEYYEDGQVKAITFDLTKDDSPKKESFWGKLKQRFKK